MNSIFDTMNEILLGTTFLLFFLEIRRKDYLSPSTIIVAIATITSLIFYLGDGTNWRFFPSLFNFWYYYGRSYSTVAHKVYIFYFFLALIGHIVGKLSRKLVMRSNPQPINRIAIFGGMTRKVLESPLVFLGFILLFFVLVMHILSVDLSKFLFYEQYLAIRNPQFIGLNNRFLISTHNALLLLSMSAPFLIYYLYRKRVEFLIFVLPIWGYSFLYAVALGSRMATVSILLMAATVYILKNKVSMSLFILLGIAGITYNISMMLRVDQIGYGIEPFILYIITGKSLTVQPIIFAAYNFFTGGFVLAEAFLKSDLYYPLIYKLLSFSPLPSFIDHFSEVRHYQHSVIVDTGPFSSWAEAYHFGYLYLFFITTILCIALYFATKVWYGRSGKYLAIIILSPLYFSLMMMQSYPIRSTFRWLLLALCLAFFVTNLNKRKKIRVG